MSSSLDVVAPALLLPIPFFSLIFSLFFYRSTHLQRALFVLIAILAAVAGGTALSVACGEPLRVVANVFTVLLHTCLSSISIYTLSPSSHTPCTFPPPFLAFFLSLAALLIACELISALIPTSPLLLPATLGLVSRTILLTFAIATAILLRRRRAAVATESSIVEKGQSPDVSTKSPGRVSSPTQATWPFPGSLAFQLESEHECTPNLPTRTQVARNTFETDGPTFIQLPLVLVIAQIFGTLAAALDVAANLFGDATTNRPWPTFVLASAVCTLLWSVAILAIVHILPANPCTGSSEKQAAIGIGQRDSVRFSHDIVPRTRKPSLCPRESESLLDFLSLRDPFASSPPPPPPLPPVGLGLDEVDVGWNGNKEISVQYRFPAPRSTVKGGRRKGKNTRTNWKKGLAHQDSSRTLLPVPETRGTDLDAERDKGFGDEALLAQLLLQSLCKDAEDPDSPNTPTLVPTVQSPQPVHVQQSSRWSTSTTIQSVVSGSISNRSGLSTYTTCASERVPPSRISMNTVASAFGSRKSSEARRKSAMTASS